MKKIVFILMMILLLLTGCGSEDNKKKIPEDLLGTYTLNTKKREFGGTYEIGNITISKSGKEYVIDLSYKYIKGKMKKINEEIQPEKILIEEILKAKGKVLEIKYADKTYDGNREEYVVYFDPKQIDITGTDKIVTKYTLAPQLWLIRQYKKDDTTICNALKIEGITYYKE